MDENKAAIEDYPHIVERISELWGNPHLVHYIRELSIDEREEDRKGFSFEVLTELEWLVEVHHVFCPHPGDDEADTDAWKERSVLD